MQKKEERMDIAEVLARRRPQRIAKRAMDIVLSAAALAVMWDRFRSGALVRRSSRASAVRSCGPKTRREKAAP